MNTHDVMKSAAEASPPVAYASLHMFGVSMPDWVAILTLVYVLLQIGHLMWRWAKSARRKHE
jgi:hypothetical protein